MKPWLIIVLAFVGTFIIFIIYSVFRFKKQLKNYDSKKDSPNILVITDNNFWTKIAGGVAIVDFWAAWCQPCKIQAPIINELADEMKDIKVCKLDVEKNQKIAGRLAIKSIPTLIIFKNGKEVERIVGVKTKNAIKKSIQKHLTIE